MPKGTGSIKIGYFMDSELNPESKMDPIGQRLLIFGRYADSATTSFPMHFGSSAKYLDYQQFLLTVLPLQ